VSIAHRSLGLRYLKRRHVQQLSEANCHALIIPEQWPPDSHDPSPLEDKIQQHVYQTKVQDVNDLRHHLIDVWAAVEQSGTDATEQWRRRLHACI